MAGKSLKGPGQPWHPTRRRSFQLNIGDRLRAIRHNHGLSLAAVEEISFGRWKGVVVGSYERGDRMASAVQLAELADFYNVPLSDLLPSKVSGARRARDITAKIAALSDELSAVLGPGVVEPSPEELQSADESSFEDEDADELAEGVPA